MTEKQANKLIDDVYSGKLKELHVTPFISKILNKRAAALIKSLDKSEKRHEAWKKKIQGYGL